MVYVVAIMVCDHHGIPCSRHGLWPSWFVAVMVYVVAIMVCGHHGIPRSRHGLWPSWFVAVMVYPVAIMICGRHGISPLILTCHHEVVAGTCPLIGPSPSLIERHQ